MSENNPSNAPKNVRLKSYIKDCIASGNLKPHDKLPTRNELVAQLGFSETTIRKGLADLEAEGVIYLHQGKGAFVAEQRVELRHFALVVPSFGQMDMWPYVNHLTSIVCSAQDEARKQNANLILYITNFDSELERVDLLRIIDSRVDGAIIYYIGGSRNIDCLKLMQERGIPFVILDRHEPEIDTDYIASDNYSSARRAMELMIKEGYRDIWHFTSQSYSSAIDERLRGYTDAMKDIDNYDESRVLRIVDGVPQHGESIYKEVLKVIDSPLERIGIFAVNGIELAIIYRHLSEHDVNLSRYAFACFDTTPIQRPGNSLFIQVRQPEDQIGRSSIRMMIDKLSGSTQTTHLILQPEIYIMNPVQSPQTDSKTILA